MCVCVCVCVCVGKLFIGEKVDYSTVRGPRHMQEFSPIKRNKKDMKQVKERNPVN